MARSNQRRDSRMDWAPWRRFAEADTTADPVTRPCDWAGCTEGGEHRAPKSRETITDYFWFCMSHAREYNKAWNYYDGMTEAEVEADRRLDTTWQRPSWHFGTAWTRRTFRADTIRDDFGVYGTAKGPNHRPGAADAPDTGLVPGSPEEQAMVTLNLSPPLSIGRIKIRYKEMVKRHHPDANGGDKVAEEKFKQIGEAYRILKAVIG